MKKKKKRFLFGEWFGRRDTAEHRAKEYQGYGWETEIRPAPKTSGWKWGLYYNRGKSKVR